jgi:hypothetical protein
MAGSWSIIFFYHTGARILQYMLSFVWKWFCIRAEVFGRAFSEG